MDPQNFPKNLKEILNPMNKEALVDALIKCGGNQTRAGGVRGVYRGNVWHRIKKYGIDPGTL